MNEWSFIMHFKKVQRKQKKQNKKQKTKHGGTKDFLKYYYSTSIFIVFGGLCLFNRGCVG
jgi:hypothetical protein